MYGGKAAIRSGRAFGIVAMTVLASAIVAEVSAKPQIDMKIAWLPAQPTSREGPPRSCEVVTKEEKGITAKTQVVEQACELLAEPAAANRFREIKIEANRRMVFGDENWASAPSIVYVYDTDFASTVYVALVEREAPTTSLFETLQVTPVDERTFGDDQLLVVNVRMREALKRKKSAVQKENKDPDKELLKDKFVSIAVRHLKAVRKLSADFGIRVDPDDFKLAADLVRTSIQGEENKQLVRGFRVGTIEELETLLKDVADLPTLWWSRNLKEAYQPFGSKNPPNCSFLRALARHREELPANIKPKFEGAVAERAKVGWPDVDAVVAKTCAKK
ncbi:MAG TPA: hypothetical protein VEC60_21675 [Reyranella sp.]|nr:hypothetical protein [Reyranella sp.]